MTTKQPACSVCGWNNESSCGYSGATQLKRFPNSTRHCTGYKCRTSDKPAAPKDKATILLTSEEAKVLVCVNKDEKYLVYASDTGKLADLKLIQVKDDEADNALHNLALTILNYFLPKLWGNLLADKFVLCHESDFKHENIWGITGKEILDWVDSNCKHNWVQRSIEKGIDKDVTLPIRCTECGAIQRPDGKSGPCPGKNLY